MNYLPMSRAGTKTNSDQSVLIVDESDDSIDVLKTLLEIRGVKTFSASKVEQGLELAWRYKPDLIVLDMEAVPSDGQAICDGFDAAARHGDAQLVLLAQTSHPKPDSAAAHIVSKPYHYAPLIRKIEQLLTSD